MTEPKVATVNHLLRNGDNGIETLLGLRVGTLFAAGIRNGPGGKKRPRESIRGCAMRELREEIGVRAKRSAVQLFASVNFYHPTNDGDCLKWIVHYFTVTEWEGEPREILCDKLRDLRWYPLANLPYSEMMADQIAWLPVTIQRHHLSWNGNGHLNSNGLLLQGDIFYENPEGTIVRDANYRFVRN